MSRTSRRTVWAAAVVLAACSAILPTGHAQQASRITADIYSRLHWRFIGPEGNRFSAAAGVPGDPTSTMSVRPQEAFTKPSTLV